MRKERFSEEQIVGILREADQDPVAQVAADGWANKISIVSAKPPQIFEQAVITALKRWKFHPARYKRREVRPGPRCRSGSI